jgi:hypothetical protein
MARPNLHPGRTRRPILWACVIVHAYLPNLLSRMPAAETMARDSLVRVSDGRTGKV